jgi:prepilin-type N-terminal cleavage/methylation domain-containing protein
MTREVDPHRSQRGFTLIEAILVITLISVMGVALANLFANGMRQSAQSSMMTAAISLANEKMEEILADKNGKGYPFIDALNYPKESNIPGFPDYSRTVSIQDTGEYKVVTVKVMHPRMVTITLTTFLTNY